MERKGDMPVRRWMLVGFFLFMVLCTIASRVYDSVTVPKVLTTVAKQKSVEVTAEGQGTVKAKERKIYTVYEGLRVGQVEVIQGSQVQEGDCLFWYDEISMAEKREELLRELEQMDFILEKEQISQESYVGLTQTEAAQWELELALREFEEGQAEFEEAFADYKEEVGRLEKEYVDSMDLTEEELWRQQEKEWENARQNLLVAKNTRDQELLAAERKIEDLEEELDLTSGEDEKAARKLERQLERAREDLENLRNSWEDRVDYARYQLDMTEDQEDRIHAGLTNVQEARKESYEAALKQQEEELETAQKTLEDQRKAVEKAQWQVHAAKKQDGAAQLSQEQKKRISDLTIKGLKLDRKAKEKELKILEEMIQTGGQVTAMEQGVVVDLEVSSGKTTTGEEIFSLAVKNSQFEGSFLKEEQKVTVGDTIQIEIPGTNKTKEAVITRINLLGDTEGIFQADLEDLELPLGTVTGYVCTKQSDLFPKVIPVTGLRKDMKGYYCLVARTSSSILGEEFRAERVEVQVVYEGSREVAVQGALFEGDQVIVGENQAIREGSRVRLVSSF